MKVVTASEAHRDFRALLKAVENGEEVLITEDGRVVARLGSAGTSSASVERDARRRDFFAELRARQVRGLPPVRRSEIYEYLDE